MRVAKRAKKVHFWVLLMSVDRSCINHVNMAPTMWRPLCRFWVITSAVMQVLSAVFCFSVVFGNTSLKYIPVSFSQAISATTPFFTAVGSYFMLRKRESAATYAALIPVVGGIVIASRFEPSFNAVGFTACLLATSMRALKSILQVHS